MTAAAVLQLVMQILSLFPTVEPLAVQAVKDLENLISGGGTVSQADIDALITRVQTQSAAIQALS